MTLLHVGSSPAARRSYSSVGPEAKTAAAAGNSGNDISSKDEQQRCDRDALHTRSPATTDHPPKARVEQLAGHGCHADMGLPRRLSST